MYIIDIIKRKVKLKIYTLGFLVLNVTNVTVIDSLAYFLSIVLLLRFNKFK